MAQLWVKEIRQEIKDELNRRKKYLSYDFGKGLNDTDYQEWNTKTPWITIYSNVKERNNEAETNSDNWNEVKINGKVQLRRDLMKDYNDELAKKNILNGIASTDENLPKSFDEIYNSNPNDDFPYRPLPTLEGLTVENIDDYGAVRKSNFKFTCYTMQQLEDMQKLYMSPGASIIAQWGWSFTKSQVEFIKFTKSNKAEESKDVFKNSEKIKEKIYDSDGNYGAFVGKITKFDWSLNDDGSFSCSTEAVSRGYVELFQNIKESTIVTIDNDELTIIDLLNKIQEKKNKFDFNEINVSGHSVWWHKTLYLSIKLIFEIINSFYIREENDKASIFKNLVVTHNESGPMLYYTVQIGNRTIHPALRSLNRNVFIIPTNTLKKNEDLELDNWFSQGWNKDTSNVDNILVSISTVIEAFSNATTYKNGVMNILEKLNTYSNGFWDLDLEISPENFVRITDKNYSSSSIPANINENNIIKEAFTFPSYGAYSMLQTLSISSELSDGMKNAAAYGGVGSPSSKTSRGFGTLYGNLRDDFNKSWGGKTEYVRDAIKKPSGKITNINEEMEKYVNSKKFFKELEIPSDYWTYIGMCWGLSDDKINNSGYTSPILIPLNLSITIDGIEGLQFGNIITIDYLPDIYRKNCAFAITGISHDISRDGWTTTIDTQFRIKSVKIDSNAKYEDIEVENTEIWVAPSENREYNDIIIPDGNLTIPEAE